MGNTRYAKTVTVLTALVAVFIVVGLFVDGAFRIIPVAGLVVLAVALGAVVGAETKRQKQAEQD